MKTNRIYCCPPGLVAGVLTLVSASLMMCQSPPPASMRSLLNADTPPERVKDLLFATILTTCPIQRTSSTATFFPHPKGDLYHSGVLYEYRNAWKKLVPMKLTEANRLYGLQFKGVAVLGASVYQFMDPNPPGDRKRAWSGWEDMQPPRIDLNPILSESLSGAENGVLVMMEKRNNEWFFSMWTGHLLSGHVKKDFDPDSFAAHKASCAVLTSADPYSAGLTPLQW